MTRLLDSSERIMGAVIVVCAIAVIAAVIADGAGLIVWIGP